MTYRLLPIICILFLAACKGNTSASTNANTTEPMAIKEETITYTADTVAMNGLVAYNENDTTKRPVVLIVHEWWGQTDYVKNRARQLAALGYLAMAVDIYGNGKTAETPDEAKALAMPFYQNPQMAKQRFDAAVEKIKTYPVADTDNIAAIGYCFGGGLLLNVARLGEDIKGVVSFHGSLLGTPADKNLLKAEILVCHGEADKFVLETEVAAFKKQMDSIGAHYTFKSYADATHAFTNPDATENGKKFSLPIAYNAAADTASFKDMQDFFGRIFK
ncbi:MAG TPA: dienelactone hydrolase family protein [Chitinophagales bacterium]|nr:dienelactone hydrolase family protein [Chitinophagales bacterium]